MSWHKLQQFSDPFAPRPLSEVLKKPTSLFFMQQAARDPTEVSFCGRRKKPSQEQDWLPQILSKANRTIRTPLITCTVISHRFGGFAHMGWSLPKLKVFCCQTGLVFVCVCARGGGGWVGGWKMLHASLEEKSRKLGRWRLDVLWRKPVKKKTNILTELKNNSHFYFQLKISKKELILNACIYVHSFFLCLLLYCDQSCIIGVRWLDRLGSGFLCHLVFSVGVDRQKNCTLEIWVCSVSLKSLISCKEQDVNKWADKSILISLQGSFCCITFHFSHSIIIKLQSYLF